MGGTYGPDPTAVLALLVVAAAVELAFHGGQGLLWGLGLLLIGVLALPFTLVMWLVGLAVDPSSMADVTIGPGAVAGTAATALLACAGVLGLRARRRQSGVRAL